MQFDRRIIWLLGVTALALLVIVLWRVRSDVADATDEVAGTADGVSQQFGPFGAPRSPAARLSPRGAAAGAPALEAEGVAGSAAYADCQTCRDQECTNFRNTGIDMYSGCLKRVDGSRGADSKDPDFIADCTAVVQCAMETRCAQTELGSAACYCGSRSIEDCYAMGPASDAPCVKQWQRATRTRDNAELAARFSDPKYPAGWAHWLLRCDQAKCSRECMSANHI